MLQMLQSHGVAHVFGLPGVHNLPFWDGDSAPRIIGVRHEQAAGYAADALARTSGGLGVAITTTGPGAMNVLAAFGEAAVSHSSVIVIASDVSSALRRQVPRGILHEMRDQAAGFAVLASNADDFAVNCTTAEQAIDALAVAIAHFEFYGEVAAYIGVATDVLAQVTTYSAAEMIEATGEPDLQPALEALGRAERPLVWLGGGAAAYTDRPAGDTLLRAFVERLGAPVVTSFAARGVLAGHELLVAAPVHEPEVNALLAAADCLIVLGSDFDGMNTRNWRIPVPSNVVTVNHAPEPIRTNLPDAVHVLGDLSVIGALTTRLARRPPWRDVHGIAAAMRARLRADERGVAGLRLVESIERAWPAEGVVIADMCVAGYWLAGYAQQPRPRRLAYPVGWGTLGYALPAAIGPASSGTPTLAVCGDGGAMFALGELATYVQEHLPITLLVNDDGGYGMLRYDQQVFGHPERGVDLLTPDWLALASSFGIDGVEASDDEFEGALHWAHARNLLGHPTLILSRTRLTPPRTTSPRWNEPM
jgi:acetolactate synthase-1/2/3 large subunit